MRTPHPRSLYLLTILLAACFFLHLIQVGSAQNGPQTAKVVRIFGTVEYQANGSAKWLPANNRQTIRQGDTLRTGDNAYVLVELSDRNIVKLLSKTTFKFDSMKVTQGFSKSNRVLVFFPATETSRNYDVTLKEGGALSVLRGLGGSSTYNLKTPVAVAGVRGTVFLAVVSPSTPVLQSALDEYSDGEKGQGAPSGGGVTASFFCLEGALQMSGAGGQNLGMIPAGTGASFTGSTPAGDQGGDEGGGNGDGSNGSSGGSSGGEGEGDGGDEGGGGGAGDGGGSGDGGPGLTSTTFNSFQDFAAGLLGDGEGGGSGDGGGGTGLLEGGAEGLAGDVQEIMNTTNPTTNEGDNPNNVNPGDSGDSSGGGERTPICYP